MRDLFSLNNKVVVLTGGFGYLGRAVAKGLLEFGAAVVIAARSHKKPAETVRGRKVCGKLADVECDVSDTVSVKEMFRQTKALYGKIDVLINCAAFGAGFGPTGTVDKMSDEDWIKGLDGTAGATFRCTREVIPYFVENGGGNIINFSSMYGLVSPDPGIYGDSGQNSPANYGAGKAAVLQLTRYCAAHLASKNIRVNSITPGPFPSPKNHPPDDFMNNLRNKTMLKRVGIPEEIVGAIILLASDASSFMTGSNIVVDGGWNAW